MTDNQEVICLLMKMNSTLESLVGKLATEGVVKKEENPKYMVSLRAACSSFKCPD